MRGTYTVTSRLCGERTFTYDTAKLPSLATCIRAAPTGGATLHLAAHISHLLLRHGLADADELLGDYGLLHELAHFHDLGPATTGCAATVESLAAMAHILQERLK